MLNKCDYEKGTWTEMWMPRGTFTRARALCPDGRLRVVKLAPCADSLWTVPAKVSYKEKTVCGYVRLTSASGLTTDPKQWVAFVPTGRHANIFRPKGAVYEGPSRL